MSPIDELKRKRFLFLHILYKRTEGNEREMVDEIEFGNELGFDRTETERVCQYLVGEDLIRYEARRAIGENGDGENVVWDGREGR